MSAEFARTPAANAALETPWPAGPDLLRATYRARMVTRIDDMEALRPDWLRLAAASTRPTLFQTPTWGLAIIRALTQAGRTDILPRLVTVHSGSHLVALLPLCVVRRHGLRILRQLGEPISQYGDVLVAPGHEAAVDTLIDALVQSNEADLVMVRRMRTESPLSVAMRDAGSTSLNMTEAPSLSFGSATASRDLMAALGKEGPDQFGSAFKKLEKFGRTKGVTHRVVLGAEAEALAREAIALKREWLAARGLTSAAFADPVWTDTLARLAGAGTVDVTGMVAVVEVDGRPIAYDVCYISAGRIYGHLGAFDSTRGDLSPGKLGVAVSVDWGLGQGLSAYDFLPPGDEYKLGWCNERAAVADHLLPLTTAGRVVGLSVEQRLKPWIKAHMDQLPPAWRALAARLA